MADFNSLFPWIQLGIEIANRYFTEHGELITKEKAETISRNEYAENSTDIAAWFTSKGLPPPT